MVVTYTAPPVRNTNRKVTTPGWQPYWVWHLAEAPATALAVLFRLHSFRTADSPHRKPLWGASAEERAFSLRKYPAYPIERSVIEPNRRPIVRLGSVIELTIKFGQSNKIERSIKEQSTIEQNRTFDYRLVRLVRKSNSQRNRCSILFWFLVRFGSIGFAGKIWF